MGRPPPLVLLPLLALLASAAPLPGDEPLDIEGFYDHRFRFDAQGQPVASVGLMDGQPEVVVRGSGPLRLRYRDDEAEKTLQVPAGKLVRMRAQQGVAARVRAWAVVETLERDDRLRRDVAMDHWARTLQGLSGEVRVFETGGIYGVEGTVVDNRASLVVAGAPEGVAMEAFLQRVYEKTGARPRVHEELLEVPRARIQLLDESGAILATARDVAELTPAPGDRVTVEKVDHSAGYKNHGVEDRTYTGRVGVVADRRGTLAVLAVLHVDELLKGIVPSEIFPTAHAEALKAQAVTARGEVFAKIGLRHLTDPYVLCDEQHCQVYSGVQNERPATSAAVEATRGEMAFLAGRLVDSVYSAMCGGRSEDNEVVWEVPPSAALRGRVDAEGAAELLATAAPHLHPSDHVTASDALVPDPTRTLAHPGLLAAVDLSDEVALRNFLANPPPAWCSRATLGRKDRFRWEKRLTRAEVNEKTKDLGVGAVVQLAVESRGKSGRLRTLKVTGTRGTAYVHRELPVRRMFGNLPSGMFVLDVEQDPTGLPAAWVFKGGGFGHGVGMCQTGAVGMAEGGHDYRAILRHYYNGAEVRRVY